MGSFEGRFRQSRPCICGPHLGMDEMNKTFHGTDKIFRSRCINEAAFIRRPLSGAPYGYRYMRKSDSSAAYYEVIESEAQVVRMVFEIYTQQGLSINSIARLLNERQIPTRTATTRWERSTVWGLLRNPAYRGRACYGKTELRPRQRITRPLRQRHGVASRDSASHERPREDWIEVPVPALVSE